MEPIALLTSAVVAAMVSVLLFLLPGVALGPFAIRSASTPLAWLGRAAGVSLLAVLIECTVLARLGVLSAASVVVVTLAISAVGIAVRRPRVRLPSVRRHRDWWAGALAASLLVLALIVVPSNLSVRPDLLPRSSTSWYYLHLAQATADLGAFPSQIGEWGALRPFPTDYLPITAHTAGALLLLPGDPLVRLEVYRLLILTLAAVFATLLFRRWISGWAAVAGAILLLGTVRLAGKFDGYRPETVALVVALFTLWVIDRAIVERDRRLMGLGVVGSAVVFLGHAEVFLIMAPAIVGIGVARLLIAPGGRGRTLGLRRPTLRGSGALGLAVGIVAAGAILGAASAWALTGQSRVLGYVAGRSAPPAELTAARGLPGEVPAGWTFTDDPTWDFYTASVAPALAGTPPPDGFTDSLLLPRSILVVWPGLDGRTRSGLVVLGALAVAPFLAWPLLDARRRRFLLAWAVFAALLIAGSLLLFSLSHTYVPQRTAGRRLLPYLLLMPVVATTLLLWLVGRWSAPGWRALLPGRGRAVAAALALAILTTGAVSAAPRADPTVDDREAALSPAGYDAYRWMAAELPADARILANAYTDGAIAAVTGRIGIVDGRAVYLEDPAFLAESTALCLGARVVFGTPSAPGTATFLARERVTHLLVATDGPNGNDLGGYLLFDTDLAAIRADPRFRLVREFDGGRILLFEVTGTEVSGG
ncbi:MAG: hypothetical protein ABI562_05675 [Chloroflexota bacterium]